MPLTSFSECVIQSEKVISYTALISNIDLLYIFKSLLSASALKEAGSPRSGQPCSNPPGPSSSFLALP